MLGKVGEIMKIFEGVEIEMFDPQDESPIDGEFVLIVLRKEIPQRSYVDYKKITQLIGNPPFSLLRICRTKVYRQNRIVFFDSVNKAHEQHTIDDIICWGRLKP